MPISRRSFGKSAVVALGAPLLAGLSQRVTAAADAAPDASQNAERAVAAYQAMQRLYYKPQVQLYQPTYPMTGGNAYSYVWPFSQALVATLDLLGLDRRYSADFQAREAGLARYWNQAPVSHNPPSPPAPASPPGYASYVPPPLGQGGDLFYDDNEWIGLAAIQQHLMTGDGAALDRARTIFELVRYGWDTDSSHPHPGGAYWTQAPWSHDRNTISNGPGAELGLHLYLLTGERAYLADSKRMFDWVNSSLLAPNGLYWDHIDLAGKVEKTQWSYNQGVMLGAAALLYRATGDGSYLDRAVQIAARALDFYGQGGRIFTQDVVFNAIFFKNLLLLDTIRPNGRYRQALQAYAETLWQAVDPDTGLLAIQPYNPVDLLVQAALVQLFALLAWTPNQYRNLA